MATAPDHHSLEEIRTARVEAQTLRDILVAEFERLGPVDPANAHDPKSAQRQQLGRDAMAKAIAAADHAINSIDQALREFQQVDRSPRS